MPATIPPVDPEVEKRIASTLRGVEGYKRDEAQTYLTLPEWLLVYYPDEYARFLDSHPASDTMTQEDRFAAQVAAEYVDFIRVTPWYEFSFLGALKRLWAETDLYSTRSILAAINLLRQQPVPQAPGDSLGQ